MLPPDSPATMIFLTFILYLSVNSFPNLKAYVGVHKRTDADVSANNSNRPFEFSPPPGIVMNCIFDAAS